MSWCVLQGDVMDRLRDLDAGSVQTCITSPPYYGLRDYGTAEWDGGDAECDHVAPRRGGPVSSSSLGPPGQQGGDWHERTFEATTEQFRDSCGKCGARRIDSQLGLEPTPDEYVAKLVEVFREVRRVLRDDGTVWLNLGDSYAANRSYQVPQTAGASGHDFGASNATTVPDGLKPKDLVGIPWRVAFALQADGWWLRSDIIWAKPNPMPESVTDRPTKAHEYIFLLSKSAKYWYDADAVREAFVYEEGGEAMPRDVHGSAMARSRPNGQPDRGNIGGFPREHGGRNKRSVWNVATQPYSEAHFATFPPKLIEPCILAGSSPKACGECGAPWERVVERKPAEILSNASEYGHGAGRNDGGRSMLVGASSETLGWQPTCSHADDTGQSIVLDPFSGSGTTGMVALRHDRSFIGIELNPEYVEMSRRRIQNDAPLFNYGLEVA